MTWVSVKFAARVASTTGRRPRGDGGSILLLSIGFCVAVLMLVWAVIGASAIFLARRDLASTVDGAALAAAQHVDADALYVSGPDGELTLDASAVSTAVAAYVDGASGDAARLVGGVDGSGKVVVVRGERDVHLPLFGTVTVTANASATNHRKVSDEAPASG